MARGRMINRELANSKKLASLPERSALLYVFAYAYSDVEGRFEADDDSLLGYAARYGRRRGWSEETVAADREALHRSGLWIVWGHGENIYAQIVDFHRHNRTRRGHESESRIPAPEGYSDDDEREKHGRSTNDGFGQETAYTAPNGDPPTLRRRPAAVRQPSAVGRQPSAGGHVSKAKGKGKGKGKAKGNLNSKAKGKAKGPLARLVDDVVQGRARQELPEEMPDELAQRRARERLLPIPGGPEAEERLLPMIARSLVLPEMDARVQALAREWSKDELHASAAHKVLLRSFEPEVRRGVRNMTGYLIQAVRDEVEELPGKIAREIDSNLEDGLRQREAMAESIREQIEG